MCVCNSLPHIFIKTRRVFTDVEMYFFFQICEYYNLIFESCFVLITYTNTGIIYVTYLLHKQAYMEDMRNTKGLEISVLIKH